MAYIKEFTVTGLAGRHDVVHHKLDRQVNVMWGMNGSGKTTLLRILHAAFYDEVRSLSAIAFDTAEIHIYSEDYKQTIIRKIGASDLQTITTDEDLVETYGAQDPTTFELVTHGSWHTHLTGKGPYNRLPRRLTHTYLPVSRVSERNSAMHRRMSSPGEVIDEQTFDSIFARQVRDVWRMYNTAALNNITSAQRQGLAEILSLLLSGDETTAPIDSSVPEASRAYEMVETFLRSQRITLQLGKKAFSDRYRQDGSLQRVVIRIQSVLDGIDESLRPQRTLEAVIGDLYRGKQLSFRADGIHVESQDRVLKLESLSSGEKQILQILLETLASSVNSVLIDEPELSMHVDWQSKLVGYMTTINPECQLLLATHSPEILASVPNSSVFEL